MPSPSHASQFYHLLHEKIIVSVFWVDETVFEKVTVDIRILKQLQHLIVLQEDSPSPPCRYSGTRQLSDVCHFSFCSGATTFMSFSHLIFGLPANPVGPNHIFF